MFAVIEEPGKEKWPFWKRARACGCVWATVGVAVGDCGRLCVLAQLTLHEAFLKAAVIPQNQMSWRNILAIDECVQQHRCDAHALTHYAKQTNRKHLMVCRIKGKPIVDLFKKDRKQIKSCCCDCFVLFFKKSYLS